MTRDTTKALLMDTAARAAAYLEALDTRSVAPAPAAVERLSAALAGDLPDAPSAAPEVPRFMDEIGAPATTANAGGRYFGFVTGGALPATVAANWLAGAWDQNAFGFVSSPAAALFEDAALRWSKQALRLPETAEGTIATGATMANFACLAAARHHVLAKAGWDVERRGLFGAPEITVVRGAEAHASLAKVLAMLGLGRERVVVVPADAEGRMRADAPPRLAGPAIVCIQAGNVHSGAFDPANEIIAWAHDAGAWVHVDGAFGLWARAAPDYAPLVRGFAAADSWASDAHKWLNVPYDSGLAFVREPEALHRAMSIDGAYLLASGRREAIDVTPESSRRARGIEVWAALRALGRDGLADLIARNCRQAARLAEGLAQAGVEVLNDVVLNQVVVAFGDDERTRRVVAAVQEGGVCWCGGSHWRGRAVMRISVSSWATTDHDIERSLIAILDAWRVTAV